MVNTVYFSVSVPFPVLDKHFVFVTGSSIKLGNWKANKALKLKKDKDDRWVGIIKLVGLPTNYTYFIGYYIKSEKSAKKDVAIFQWETLVKPRSLLTSHVLANKRVKLYNVFGEEGDDIKYNFDQVLPGDSLELSIKKEIGGVKGVDLDLKKKSKTVSGTQHKKKDDIINEKNDQIKEKNRQIRTLRGRITQLEQDKNALKDDNKYLTQQNKYLTDCLLKSLPSL
ncbi:unnamed protein product [Meloidogyne enterolobii]|uniref:Uncharacterized protein n=1 Tax=Meloidogyne enterolobii TaxID=390850 RepID=A0ACB1AIX9_MELEN